MEAGKDNVVTVVYRRNSGDPPGLMGIWKPVSFHSRTPVRLKHDASGTSGLRATNQTGIVQTLMFNGKPTAATGPTVIPGMMAATRVVNDHTLE